jgi:hypothetical protein
LSRRNRREPDQEIGGKRQASVDAPDIPGADDRARKDDRLN